MQQNLSNKENIKHLHPRFSRGMVSLSDQIVIKQSINYCQHEILYYSNTIRKFTVLASHVRLELKID